MGAVCINDILKLFLYIPLPPYPVKPLKPFTGFTGVVGSPFFIFISNLLLIVWGVFCSFHWVYLYLVCLWIL